MPLEMDSWKDVIHATRSINTDWIGIQGHHLKLDKIVRNDAAKKLIKTTEFSKNNWWPGTVNKKVNLTGTSITVS